MLKTTFEILNIICILSLIRPVLTCMLWEFGFSTGFFCIVLLSCLQNTLIDINFDVLKYIKKIFKVSMSVYFKSTAEDNTKKPSKESGFMLWR